MSNLRQRLVAPAPSAPGKMRNLAVAALMPQGPGTLRGYGSYLNFFNDAWTELVGVNDWVAFVWWHTLSFLVLLVVTIVYGVQNITGGTASTVYAAKNYANYSSSGQVSTPSLTPGPWTFPLQGLILGVLITALVIHFMVMFAVMISSCSCCSAVDVGMVEPGLDTGSEGDTVSVLAARFKRTPIRATDLPLAVIESITLGSFAYIILNFLGVKDFVADYMLSAMTVIFIFSVALSDQIANMIRSNHVSAVASATAARRAREAVQGARGPKVTPGEQATALGAVAEALKEDGEAVAKNIMVLFTELGTVLTLLVILPFFSFASVWVAMFTPYSYIATASPASYNQVVIFWIFALFFPMRLLIWAVQSGPYLYTFMWKKSDEQSDTVWVFWMVFLPAALNHVLYWVELTVFVFLISNQYPPSAAYTV